MDALRLGQPGNFWNAPTYSVKVRGTKYLWGSAGVTTNLSFDKPFILHIANDHTSEPVTIGTRVAEGVETALGIIAPGECLSVSVAEISGIYAKCTKDSLVHCLIY